MPFELLIGIVPEANKRNWCNFQNSFTNGVGIAVEVYSVNIV